MRAAALSTLLLLSVAPAYAATAPKPLYRDPVYDGAADVSTVYDRAHKRWTMFYTNRRATMKLPDPNDVSWVHGTPIGMATSKDGMRWHYQGMAKIPESCTGATLWAPEIFHEAGAWHMWLTVVPGIFKNWDGARKIVHLTSSDLEHWTCGATLDVGSDRIIDASVVKLDTGAYRIWFKDERKDSRIFAADSNDLVHWTRQDTPVVDMGAEGPKVFRFKGYWWMVADAWKGLIVLRSDDAQTWTLQDSRLLEAPGTRPTDTAKGQHPDVVVNDGRAFIYYFVHQEAEPQAKADPYWHQRTVIQMAELKYADGKLGVDRDAPVDATLKAPR
jgi:hypothetical protein